MLRPAAGISDAKCSHECHGRPSRADARAAQTSVRGLSDSVQKVKITPNFSFAKVLPAEGDEDEVTLSVCEQRNAAWVGTTLRGRRASEKKLER